MQVEEWFRADRVRGVRPGTTVAGEEEMGSPQVGRGKPVGGASPAEDELVWVILA